MGLLRWWAALDRHSFPSALLFYLGFVVWTIYVVSSLVLANTFIIVLSPLLLIHPLAFRIITESMAHLAWPIFMYNHEIIGRNKIIYYCKRNSANLNQRSQKMGENLSELPDQENAIVLTNHISYVDWATCFGLGVRKKMIGSIKVTVKSAIRYIPVIGTSLLGMGYIFMSRKWENDKVKLARAFNNLKKYPQLPFWLLIHPEGSRATPAKIKESQEFAKKRDLPQLQHVLLPRVKGFTTCTMALRENIKAVYDITVAYSSHPRHFFILWSGYAPIQVHILVRRFPIESIPEDENGLTNWLYKLYQEKDEFINEFKKHGKYISATAYEDPLPVDQIEKKMFWWTIILITGWTFVIYLISKFFFV